MTKTDRNIGAEILDGIRRIKRGEVGRITTVPSQETEQSRAVFTWLLPAG
jgi:hypothetical protein